MYRARPAAAAHCILLHLHLAYEVPTDWCSYRNQQIQSLSEKMQAIEQNSPTDVLAPHAACSRERDVSMRSAVDLVLTPGPLASPAAP